MLLKFLFFNKIVFFNKTKLAKLFYIKKKSKYQCELLNKSRFSVLKTTYFSVCNLCYKDLNKKQLVIFNFVKNLLQT